MIQPRFNFVQLLGIVWLTPALLVLSILIEEQPPPDDVRFFLLVAFIFLIVSGNFLFKKKWVRYLVLIGLILSVIGMTLMFIGTLGNIFYDFREAALCLSGITFLIGLFLLLFNISTTIEFERKRKEPIDYTKVLYDAQLNQSYFLKNTFDLTTCIGLILLAPSFFLLTALYHQISRGYFNNTSDLFLTLLAFGSLICGIGTFLKFKFVRYIPLILFALIPLFMLTEIPGSISYKELMFIGSLLITGITFSVAVGAILFHPITTHSFENTVESIDDYDDILDIE